MSKKTKIKLSKEQGKLFKQWGITAQQGDQKFACLPHWIMADKDGVYLIDPEDVPVAIKKLAGTDIIKRLL